MRGPIATQREINSFADCRRKARPRVPGVRHANVEQLNGVIGNGLRFLRLSIPSGHRAPGVAMVMFSAAAISRNKPCSLRFSVRKPMPRSMASRGSGSPPVHHRLQSFRLSLSARRRSTAPVRNVRHPPVRRGQQFRRNAPAGYSAGLCRRRSGGEHSGGAFTERDIALFIEQIAQWPADHHPHQLPALRLSRVRLPTYCPSRSTLTRSESSYTSAMRWLM